MPKDRPSLAFFALIATSLCAAVVLIALLIAGDVAGPKVAMNNLPSHSQAGDRQWFTLGVLKSLGHPSFGPVVLVHTHEARIQYGKPTCV